MIVGMYGTSASPRFPMEYSLEMSSNSTNFLASLASVCFTFCLKLNTLIGTKTFQKDLQFLFDIIRLL